MTADILDGISHQRISTNIILREKTQMSITCLKIIAIFQSCNMLWRVCVWFVQNKDNSIALVMELYLFLHKPQLHCISNRMMTLCRNPNDVKTFNKYHCFSTIKVPRFTLHPAGRQPVLFLQDTDIYHISCTCEENKMNDIKLVH